MTPPAPFFAVEHYLQPESTGFALFSAQLLQSCENEAAPPHLADCDGCIRRRSLATCPIPVHSVPCLVQGLHPLSSSPLLTFTFGYQNSDNAEAGSVREPMPGVYSASPARKEDDRRQKKKSRASFKEPIAVARNHCAFAPLSHLLKSCLGLPLYPEHPGKPELRVAYLAQSPDVCSVRPLCGREAMQRVPCLDLIAPARIASSSAPSGSPPLQAEAARKPPTDTIPCAGGPCRNVPTSAHQCTGTVPLMDGTQYPGMFPVLKSSLQRTTCTPHETKSSGIGSRSC